MSRSFFLPLFPSFLSFPSFSFFLGGGGWGGGEEGLKKRRPKKKEKGPLDRR